MGLTLSRKVGNAVRRNRWKRRIREIFRRNKDEFPKGYDFVVIVRKQVRDAEEPDFLSLRDDLIEMTRLTS